MLASQAPPRPHYSSRTAMLRAAADISNLLKERINFYASPEALVHCHDDEVVLFAYNLFLLQDETEWEEVDGIIDSSCITILERMGDSITYYQRKEVAAWMKKYNIKPALEAGFTFYTELGTRSHPGEELAMIYSVNLADHRAPGTYTYGFPLIKDVCQRSVPFEDIEGKLGIT